MKLKEEKLTLKCLLTNEEKINYSEEQSKALVEKSAKDAELRAFSGEIKADILSLDSRIVALANKINNGYEHRSVKCKIEYDYPNKIKRWIRLDTGEISKEDIMADEEMIEQQELINPENN
jgi:translation initiation factor 6 (eIF-6)